MVQVLEASVLGALLYLGLGELGQQNCLSQVVRRRGWNMKDAGGYTKGHTPKNSLCSPRSTSWSSVTSYCYMK